MSDRAPAWVRTPAAERWMAHAAALLVAATGVAYAVLAYALEAPADDPYTIVNHPWQPQALHAHVLAAPLLVLALGMLLRQHVVARLRNPGYRRSRRTGLCLSVLAGPMIASGYLLQVTTHEGWLRAWLVLHLATSGGFVIAWLLHLRSARRSLGLP